MYDYDKNKVRDLLVKGFKSKNAESTVADLAGLTGLPLSQIEAELPAISDEYGARLKVTQTGEILYSFPRGMKSRYNGFVPKLKRFLKSLKKGAIEVGKAAFKAWIVVMLVGYFVLFIALALFAMVASIAIQQGGNGRSSSSRRSSSGLGGLWLTGRLFDSLIRIWFYSELFKGPEARASRFEAKKARYPLHKAIFSHVFGDGDPNKDWAAVEKKAVVAFLQTHKGVMTMAEFMAMTGHEPEDAEMAINAYLLEFEGSPEVSPQGHVYFQFPKLLSQLGSTPEVAGSTVLLKRTRKFSSNSKKSDMIFRLINGFNVVFGGYFLWAALSVGPEVYIRTAEGWALRGGLPFLYSASAYLFQILGIANPIPLLGWGLGVTPLLFSSLFFAIPLIRSVRLAAENEAIRADNLRKIAYRNILAAEGPFKPESLAISIEEAKPRDPRVLTKIVDRFAAWARAEPVDQGYSFDSVAESQKEIVAIRARVDQGSYAPGPVVFDSDS
ncbi:MAG: hypothetical protein FD137_772 [Spirochaetes bacterium]|nr:MAG: hypothetical protein FD137_772 [Spirochaetota bacterium]